MKEVLVVLIGIAVVMALVWTSVVGSFLDAVTGFTVVTLAFNKVVVPANILVLVDNIGILFVVVDTAADLVGCDSVVDLPGISVDVDAP